MAGRLPAMRVDHVSVAVSAISPALAFFRRLLPVVVGTAPTAGYDGQFRWCDFFVGDWKLELIESARPGSFVERFLARRGEGFHHLSLEVEADGLDDHVAFLERQGLRIVDRADYGGGNKTAFISPRTSPGILVQFWQVPGYHGGPPAGHSTDPVAADGGVRFRVDHLALAVHAIDPALDWFRRIFPVEVTRPKQPGWDGSHNLLHLRLAGHEIELLEPARAESFVARFLARRGEGFHHVAIDVDRLAPLVARLERAGIAVVDRRTIAGGRETAFVHPRDAHGVLVQFWQEAELGGPRRP
jgi:methylmalonyl-CoA/ethylmalonyl-CoA epimerase